MFARTLTAADVCVFDPVFAVTLFSARATPLPLLDRPVLSGSVAWRQTRALARVAIYVRRIATSTWRSSYRDNPDLLIPRSCF